MARVVPPQTVAAHEVLRAVREAMAELPDGLVLVACSGGPDSLALAAATADVVAADGRSAGALVVDHGLQDGSADVADAAARQCTGLGLSPVIVVRVDVPRSADGPEAAARSARYEAMDAAAQRQHGVAVLLGHSMDDQAETVLLGLARGSGTRSLAGMRPARGLYVRPLLGVRRNTLREACDHWGLQPWTDPHNSDPVYSRVRVRKEVIPVLESQLGPGVVAALARTARIARADSDALDRWAIVEWKQLETRTQDQGSGQGPLGLGLNVDDLTELPFAVLTRVIRLWLVAEGCPGSRLTAGHVWSATRLVDQWHGQGKLSVPGGIAVWRECDTLLTGPDSPFSSYRESKSGRPEDEDGRVGVESGGSGRDSDCSGHDPDRPGHETERSEHEIDRSGYQNGESEEL